MTHRISGKIKSLHQSPGGFSMSQYHHFTMFEREKIFFFLAQNKSIRFIAKELGRSPSSVSRELKRNSINNDYSPSKAEKKYKKRRKNAIVPSCFPTRYYLLLYPRGFSNNNGHLKKLQVGWFMNNLI